MKKFTIVMLSVLLASLTHVAAVEPHRGYRGFAELAGDANIDISFYGGEPTNSGFYTGVSTSHGFQFNRWIFVGGGLVIENFVKENETYAAAAFAQVRTDLWLGRFKPHIDVRAGYNMATYGGVYFCPTIGYRINTRSAVGVNIDLGLSVVGNRSGFEYWSPAEGWTLWQRRHQYDTTFHFRVGIDFQL